MKAEQESECFSHAYLLVFEDARNLREALKTFAKLFFNADETENRVAGLIDTESFSDCLFFPENGKKFVVEDAEKLAEESLLRPVEGEKKAFVVGDFAEATPAAQNKLLKLLEEPPAGVVFLLGATTAFPVLPTVLSRVKTLEIPPFEPKEIAACLARIYKTDKYTADDFSLCAFVSGGVLGNAQNMLEGGAYRQMLEDTFALCGGGVSTLPALVKRLGDTKRKKELLSLLGTVYRDALLIKTGQEKYLLLQGETARLKALAQGYTLSALVKAQELISKAEREVFFNAYFPQCLEVLLGSIYAANK